MLSPCSLADRVRLGCCFASEERQPGNHLRIMPSSARVRTYQGAGAWEEEAAAGGEEHEAVYHDTGRGRRGAGPLNQVTIQSNDAPGIKGDASTLVRMVSYHVHGVLMGKVKVW